LGFIRDLRFPGGKADWWQAGKTVHNLISNADIAPTLLHLISGIDPAQAGTVSFAVCFGCLSLILLFRQIYTLISNIYGSILSPHPVPKGWLRVTHIA